MCGRFDFHGDDADVAAAFGLHLPPTRLAAAPKYNIAPTTPACVVYAGPSGPQVVWMKFGWLRDVPRRRLIINARSETVQQRGMFRAAFTKRRCAVLAHGFYEWDKSTRPRQPWYVSPVQGTLFGLAGLWEAPDAAQQEHDVKGNFVVLTTAASVKVAALHDRMPVMLRPQEALAWAVGTAAEAEQLMPGSYPDAHLQAYRVSVAVNDARTDNADCITKR